jgi:hypothetical protein
MTKGQFTVLMFIPQLLLLGSGVAVLLLTVMSHGNVLLGT